MTLKEHEELAKKFLKEPDWYDEARQIVRAYPEAVAMLRACQKAMGSVNEALARMVRDKRAMENELIDAAARLDKVLAKVDGKK